MSKEVKVGELTQEEQLANAQKVIEQEKQERVKICMLEIQSVLEKYNCQIVPTVNVVLNGQQVQSTVISK